MKKYLLVLTALCMGSTKIMAQQTGSFNANITFNSETRVLSNYVPTDYNASQSYRLVIGLHGLGDNSTNYRDALVNSLNFKTGFPNTILICPDGGSDQGKDFYAPQGDEAIIQEAINYATANYNINASEIILQGFSLGGKSALKYGLEHTSVFKALLLNTPAIQGVKEAHNNLARFTYDYTKASQLPIYVTLGNTDYIYDEPINVAVRNLVKNNGKVSYKKFAGGHTVPDFGAYPYADFFNQPYNNGPDAGIYDVSAPVRSCDGNIQAGVLLQNNGADALQSVKMAYGIGSAKDTFVWQGNLATHAHANVQLPVYKAAVASANYYDFDVEVIDANLNNEDTLEDFNMFSKQVHVMTNALTLPFEERFSTTQSLEKWASNNSGDYILPFDYTQSDGAVFTFNSIFIFENSGTREEIISPNLNLSGQSNVYLHFKTDYNYTMYTAAVFGVDTVFADTLEVLVSTDCGANYSRVFRKGGADLTSQSTPITNATNINQVTPNVDPGKYKSFMVDLSSYAGQQNVHVKFSYISALGGYIYLDDVIVNNSPASVEQVAEKAVQVKLYPNPATDQLTVSLNDEAIKTIKVFNAMGQPVHTQEGNSNAATINVSRLPKGTYWITVTGEEHTVQDKFVVQ